MRQQYYFRPSPRGLLAWDVNRLVELAGTLPRQQVSLETIRELDELWAGDDEPRTWRALVEHVRLIDAADLSYPIILSAGGAVMDGMHRVVKAARQGRLTIDAVRGPPTRRIAVLKLWLTRDGFRKTNHTRRGLL